MFTLDSVVPKFPLTCITRNDRDLAICCPTGIYILEDYALTSVKRRFFPLQQEFRAIIYTAANSVQLIGLTADGQSIWLIDALDGNLTQLLIGKFTSIQMKSETELLIGTFNGEIITKSLLNESIESQKYSEYPISFICNDLIHFFDSQGRLFAKEKKIYDDGILQPCRILKTSDKLFFIKHCSVYIFNAQTDNLLTKLTVGNVICAAELDQNDNLIIATDRHQLYTLEGLKLKELDANNAAEAQESDDENDSGDSDEEEREIFDKNERIFSLIRHPNASSVLVLKVDSVNKRAWIEEVQTNNSNHNSSTFVNPDFTVSSVNVCCPLCDESNQQQILPINTISCLKGHPITICSQSHQLILTKCYNCRYCHCAFTTNPQICPFCNGLITK